MNGQRLICALIVSAVFINIKHAAATIEKYEDDYRQCICVVKLNPKLKIYAKLDGSGSVSANLGLAHETTTAATYNDEGQQADYEDLAGGSYNYYGAQLGVKGQGHAHHYKYQKQFVGGQEGASVHYGGKWQAAGHAAAAAGMQYGAKWQAGVGFQAGAHGQAGFVTAGGFQAGGEAGFVTGGGFQGGDREEPAVETVTDKLSLGIEPKPEFQDDDKGQANVQIGENFEAEGEGGVVLGGGKAQAGLVIGEFEAGAHGAAGSTGYEFKANWTENKAGGTQHYEIVGGNWTENTKEGLKKWKFIGVNKLADWSTEIGAGWQANGKYNFTAAVTSHFNGSTKINWNIGSNTSSEMSHWITDITTDGYWKKISGGIKIELPQSYIMYHFKLPKLPLSYEDFDMQVKAINEAYYRYRNQLIDQLRVKIDTSIKEEFSIEIQSQIDYFFGVVQQSSQQFLSRQDLTMDDKNNQINCLNQKFMKFCSLREEAMASYTKCMRTNPVITAAYLENLEVSIKNLFTQYLEYVNLRIQESLATFDRAATAWEKGFIPCVRTSLYNFEEVALGSHNQMMNCLIHGE